MRNECIGIVNNGIRKENIFKEKYLLLYLEILSYNCNLEISWLNKLYNYVYDIKHKNCEYCNKELLFSKKFKIGYGRFCSKSCTSKGTRKEVRETNLRNFGVEYPLQNKEIKLRVQQTNLEKYGVKSTLSLIDVQNKIKNTIKEKYGVDNISQSIEIKEKIRKTLRNNYGVDNPFKSEIIKKRIKVTNKNKSDSEKNVIKEKIKKTNQIRYNTCSVLTLDENRKKLKKSILDKYGVEYPLQSEEIRTKIHETIKKIYGVENASQSSRSKKSVKLNILNKWSKLLKISVDDLSYNNGVFNIKNYCKNHNGFNIKYDDLYNRYYTGCENICTNCNKINKQSKIKENEIKTYLTLLNIKYECNNRKLLNGKEIDFYFLEHKLGIEFNGLYWHSNKYAPNHYHINKTDECERQGIQLLHVFEDEWIFKKEIVKSIIKSKLGVVENKIFARKCEIREIDSKLSSEFLNINHIQGNVNTKIKIGLFYDDELVSLMTFGKKRIAMGNKILVDGEYEMLRFCNRLNTQVIGGASKLLKYFIHTYNPKSILTFADRRYSQGGLYKQLGFRFIENTKPNYYYFIKNKLIRYHRFNFRKDILVKEGFDVNKTEFQIMSERGYLRIHDCGNMKFLLTI